MLLGNAFALVLKNNFHELPQSGLVTVCPTWAARATDPRLVIPLSATQLIVG